MRVVVTGATGNVGHALVPALLAADDDVLGVARRAPSASRSGPTWFEADIVSDDLATPFAGADAVVHLAWVLHPVREPAKTWKVNVGGTRRVLEAVVAARVPALVYLSSVGAYSAGDNGAPVTESYATDGIATSTYSREKAYVERLLDAFEAAHPEVRVVRLRPGLIFQAAAGPEVRQLFVGRLIPRFLYGDGTPPVMPHVPGLAFQAVHASDVASAVVAALHRDVRGPFNVVADPVLTTEVLAGALGARAVALPAPLVRAAAAASFALHLQRSEPGWFDLAMSCPILDGSRARAELDWRPQHSATDAFIEVMAALARDPAEAPTPQLRRPRDAE